MRFDDDLMTIQSRFIRPGQELKNEMGTVVRHLANLYIILFLLEIFAPVRSRRENLAEWL